MIPDISRAWCLEVFLEYHMWRACGVYIFILNPRTELMTAVRINELPSNRFTNWSTLRPCRMAPKTCEKYLLVYVNHLNDKPTLNASQVELMLVISDRGPPPLQVVLKREILQKCIHKTVRQGPVIVSTHSPDSYVRVLNSASPHPGNKGYYIRIWVFVALELRMNTFERAPLNV